MRLQTLLALFLADPSPCSALSSAETEQHFPNLTVGQTLDFAANARCVSRPSLYLLTGEVADRRSSGQPRTPPGGLSQLEWSQQLAAVMMAVFGISDTRDVKVGNDYIRGVSGGQRKRVSIAEVALSNAPLTLVRISVLSPHSRSLNSLPLALAVGQLDAWSRLCDGHRLLPVDQGRVRLISSSWKLAQLIHGSSLSPRSVELNNSVACVAIYQAPQPAYDVFDKVIVLYEGQQIYFGPTGEAKQFFVDMGFYCAE